MLSLRAKSKNPILSETTTPVTVEILRRFAPQNASLLVINPMVGGHQGETLRETELVRFPVLRTTPFQRNLLRGTFAGPDTLPEFGEAPSQSVIVR